MKFVHTLAGFAVVVVVAAQNEFPDPEFDPNQGLTPLELLRADVRPFALELSNVNTSVIELDKAIIAFDGAEDVAPTLQAAQNLLDTINAEAADALTHPQISGNTSTDEGAAAVGPLLDYTQSLIYHINHTVVNLVLKEDLAVKYCQGPAVLAAIEDQTTAAQGLIDKIVAKVPDDLQADAPIFVNRIFEILGSASSAYADQTTTSPGCTPPPTTTTGPTTSPTTTTTGTGNDGAWQTWDSDSTLSISCTTTITSGPSKPTGWSNYGDDKDPESSGSDKPTGWSGYGSQGESSGSSSKGSGAYTTAGWSAVTTGNYSKPTTTNIVGTYTGDGALANNVCVGTVVFVALAAYLL